MVKRAGQAAGTEYIALPAGSVEHDGTEFDDRTDEERAFDEFVTGIGAEKMGELRVGKLKRANDGSPLANARSAHCFSCPIDQYNFSELLEYIRSRYGGGLFRVVGIEAGKRGVAFNKIIEIAEDIGPQNRTQESPLQNPHNLFESVAKIMAESQARTEGLIARLSENRPAPAQPVDPMAMMTQMAGLMATLMGVIPKPTTQSDDLLGQVEKVLKLKELLGGGNSGDGGGAESNFFDVVKTGLQSFGPALAALAIKTAQNGAPALEAPAGTQTMLPQAPPRAKQPGPTRAATDPQNNNPGDPAMASLKQQVSLLVQNAKMGANPMDVAGMILDLTPDESLDNLETMLKDPAMIEKMAALNPEVQVYRDFFVKLRDSLLTLLMEDNANTLPADGGDSAAPPGTSGAATA